MTIDRRAILGLAAGAVALPALPAPAAAQGGIPAGLPGPDLSFDLWPGGAPGAPSALPAEAVIERSDDPAFSDRALVHVARPRLDLFRPARPNGAAVLIMPGGGYQRVVIDKEGHELGRWLCERGFTAFVLFYRLPGDGWAAGPDVALADARRAMRLIRHRARQFAIDAERVAALGFSAGGHLCADLATRFAHRIGDPVDAADALSARPRLAAPIYPVVSMSAPAAHGGSRAQLIGEGAGAARERAHSPHLNVPADAPPLFLVHAEDDAAVPVENSLLLRAAWRDRGLPVETHLFREGGHGFGLRGAAGKPAAAWPELFVRWAASVGL